MSDDLIEMIKTMSDFGTCPAFDCKCEYVSMVEAQAAEIERLREALNDAAEVIENCNDVFLHKWGSTNKWRNAVLAKARAALAEKEHLK